jgi:tRNA(Glu) U13 pseudouridine synthase TruD
MRYEIADWIARRNRYVSSGNGGTRDRRAVTSQTVIQTSAGKDTTDVSVPYILLADTQGMKTVSFSLKG